MTKRTLLSTLGLVGVLLFPTLKSEAQTLPDSINPFKQPIATTRFYGSGDVNQDGKVDNADYSLMQSSHPQNDEADLDFDGVKSSSNDLSLLNQHLTTGKKLPSDWLRITRQEREQNLSKMLAIDKTDTNTYRPDFISGDFARQLAINFNGLNGHVLQPQPDFKYDTTNIGRFNIPVYNVGVVTSNASHGMNAILVGENPLNFNDWNFIEPQTDWANVQPGTQSIPLNSKVKINYLVWYYSNNLSKNLSIQDNFITFNIDGSGNPSLDSYTSRLVLTRDTTTTGVNDSRLEETVRNFTLEQNYPNPFNNQTSIQYYLKEREDVTIKVNDINGREIKTLYKGNQNPGKHVLTFDAKGLSSGTYFYSITAGNYTVAKKMVLQK